MEKSAVSVVMSNNGNNCANCQHLVTKVLPGGGQMNYVCRRFPPVPVGGPIPISATQIKVIAEANWPVIGTPADCWCGEFKAKAN